MRNVVAGGCFGIIVFLLFTGLIYSALGWLVVSAINLFVAEPFEFGFWSYMLVGWVLAVVTNLLKRG